jgi:hypothetical protein
MTEAEWNAAADPDAMLEHLKGLGHGRTKGGQRRLRLFCCACCRRIWPQLDDESRAAVEAGERSADGLLGKQELAQVETQTKHRAWGAAPYTKRGQALWACHNAVRPGAPPKRAAAVAYLVGCVVAEGEADQIRKSANGRRPDPRLPDLRVEDAAQCALLRDIFGNPFRPASLPPVCRTPAAVSLAQAAYEERVLPSGELGPARLAVLADALEDAGCTSVEILTHLRGPGPHTRGCWPIDLIRGVT